MYTGIEDYTQIDYSANANKVSSLKHIFPETLYASTISQPKSTHVLLICFPIQLIKKS